MLFLVRHAHAVDETRAVHDAERHLSAAGRADATALGERLRWYDCAPVAVWTSPLVRAVQTAELLIAGLHWPGVIECVPALAPDGNAHVVEKMLAGVDGAVMVIGHEPGISALGAVVTHWPDFPALKKCQIARIEGDRLKWTFAPGDAEPQKVRRPGTLTG